MTEPMIPFDGVIDVVAADTRLSSLIDDTPPVLADLLRHLAQLDRDDDVSRFGSYVGHEGRKTND